MPNLTTLIIASAGTVIASVLVITIIILREERDWKCLREIKSIM